jgi:hypothetical protein
MRLTDEEIHLAMLEASRRQRSPFISSWGWLKAFVKALPTENADAARYQWIRNNEGKNGNDNFPHMWHNLSPEDLDKAIDEEIRNGAA